MQEISKDSNVKELQAELSRKDAIIEEQRKVIESLQEELMNQQKKIEHFEVNSVSNRETTKSTTTQQPQSRYWTPEEHQLFLEAISKFGSKDVKAVANYVGTRNATQVRTHSQKYFLRLERERKRIEEEQNRSSKGESSETKTKRSKRKRATAMDIPPSALAPSLIHTPIPTPKTEVDQNSVSTPKFSKLQTSTIPYFIQQQIAAETRESVLNTLKGWTPSDYNSFIEGLVSYSDEKDINVRCRLISEHYLPNHTPDDIKQCFLVLSSVAKSKDHDREQKDFSLDSFKPNPLQIFQHKLLGHENGVPQSMPARTPFNLQQLNVPYMSRNLDTTPFGFHNYMSSAPILPDEFTQRQTLLSQPDPFVKPPNEQERFFPVDPHTTWTPPNEEYQ